MVLKKISYGICLLIPLFLLSMGLNQITNASTLPENSSSENSPEKEYSPEEKLFLDALKVFRQQKYSRARSKFKQIVSDYPSSPRAKDSLYYLDRIKLYEPQHTTVPQVRVRLYQGRKTGGSVTGSVIVINDSGKKIDRIRPGESWNVEIRGESMIFSIGNRSRYRTPELQLQVVDQGYLKHRDRTYRGTFQISKRNQEVLLINELSISGYLYGVVRKEIAPDWPWETIKAQAVAARSFALYHMSNRKNDNFDLGSTNLSQLYGGVQAETHRINEAVDETRGEVLTFNGKVIPAFFHANSGGHIENAESIWEGSRTPFITAKPDTWSLDTQHSNWNNTLPYNTLNDALQSANLPPMKVGSLFEISERLNSGRALKIRYQTNNSSQHEIRAEELRHATGSKVIKSSWFLDISKRKNKLHIKGKGWGHGIGMSQWGAKQMAENDHDYMAILQHYYDGASLTRNYGPASLQPEMVSE